LKNLTASIEKQIDAAKAKISELSGASADKAKSLQSDLSGIVGEITKQFEQAKARAAEIGKS
jgi:hypothetical protein